MKKNLILKSVFIFLIGISFISFISSYSDSNIQYSQFQGFDMFSFSPSTLQVDPSICEEAGQDFVVQIPPFGCTPSVVRSDLLEEQNVPVYCQLSATKINPLINVKGIDGISVLGDLPNEVSGVGFLPARAALGINGVGLESSVMQNIGYAVIVLKQQPNESSLTNCEGSDFGEVCWVEGELKTNLKYDVENAFGIGKVVHSLPILSDSEWEEKQNQYSFWNAKGFLRAEDVLDESAVISIYDNNGRLQTVNLQEGQISEDIYLPGYTCLSSLKLKLNDLESPDTKVRLKIDNDFIEVNKGEKFLDDRCYVVDMYEAGITKKVTIKCKEDDDGFFKSKAYDLTVAPKVRISIGPDENDYSLGDLLYTYNEGARKFYVYLAFISSESGSNEDLEIGIISIPEERNGDKLTDDEIEYVGKLFDSYRLDWESNRGQGSVGNLLQNVLKNAWQGISGTVSNVYNYLLDGKQVRFIDYQGNVNVMGETNNEPKLVFDNRNVKVLGFAEPINKEFDFNSADGSLIKKYYDLSESDFDVLLENFESEKNSENIEYGLIALVEKIWLNSDLQQKRNVYDLCQKLEENYDNIDPFDVDRYCSGLEISNQQSSSVLVFVNGKATRISLFDINEPSEEEYSAEIKIRGPNGKFETVVLTKNEPYYLEGFRYVEGQPIAVGTSQTYKYNEDIGWQWLTDQENYVSVSLDNTNHLYRQLNINLRGKDFIEGVRIINARTNILLNAESIELIDLERGMAKIRISVWDKGVTKQIKDTLIGSTQTLISDEPRSFGSEYSFVLSKVNLEKEAKVSVIPNIYNTDSQTNFSFKIGIEKRGIQLTPSQTISKIRTLNNTIKDWEEKGEKVGSAVDVFKDACLIGGAALTVKNFFANLDGKGIARQDVMNGEGGWKQRCQDFVGEGTYSSIEECYSRKASEIEQDVTDAARILENQNKEIKERQSDITNDGGIFGESVTDTNKLMEKSIPETLKELDKEETKKYISSIKDSQGNPINIDKILNYDIWKNQGTFTLEQLRDIEYNSRILNDNQASDTLKENAKKELNSIFGKISTASESYLQKISITNKFNVGSSHIVSSFNKDTKILPYTGNKGTDIQGNFDFISDDDLVQIIETSKGNYVVALDDSLGTGKMKIKTDSVYDADTGSYVSPDDIPSELNNFVFEKRDSSSYKNEIKKPEIKYYETPPYEGLPAIVPVDIKNGWYAFVKQDIPITSGIKSYDKSGRVSSFYLCNVGENSIIDGTTRDDCMLINLGTRQPYNILPGLSETQAKTLINNAIKAIEQASQQHGSNQVSILGQIMKVGSPAADIASMQCQDFMSPNDCKLLFNLCDPVICPSSRCDFGGTYPVRDPIQTGIIGGLTLCLPNWNEGIYVPICLSGVKAGIDGLVSVYGSYRDCLQESLDTGKTIGICDEMHSVYLCEFFWRQALPLAEIGIPKLISVVAGQTASRGGSEYLGVQNAWDNSKKSLTYFTQTYATNAFNAFKSRSTEQIGADVCKNFASGVVPNLEIFDAISELDTPHQFTGRFDEIPFSTTTNPPTSHYKVFYHIYAGESNSGYYKVYLKGSSTSSFYQDASSSRLVAQGYMTQGGTISETKDFTAPSGYKELCIEVNGQEECGFKQVSTSFALDYVKDQYIREQTTQTNIQTEQECISGTASAYSLLNPNIQEAAGDLIDPQIYNYGIVRVCSTRNPGEGTDPFVGTNQSRWIQVGNCGNENLKCWLDTNKIDEITTLTTTEDSILSDVTENVLDIASKEERENVDKIYNDINYGRITNDDKLLSKINEIIDKVYFNNQKARLYLFRGRIYHQMAKDLFEKNTKKQDDAISIQKAEELIDPLEQTYLDEEQAIQDALSEQLEDKENRLMDEGDIYTTTQFSEKELEILSKIRSVSGCELCGEGFFNFCGEIECNAISEKVKEVTNGRAFCEFRRPFSANACYPKIVEDQTIPLSDEGQANV